MKKLYLSIILFIFISPSSFSLNITWTGSTSNSWSDSTNFSPMVVPTQWDTVTIDTTANHPILSGNTRVYKLIMYGDTLDLNGYQLQTGDEGEFRGGVIMNGNLKCSGTLAYFSGTIIDAEVIATCEGIQISESVFHQKTYFENTGSVSSLSHGGNVFHDVVTLKNSSSDEDLIMAYSYGDVFHDSLYVIINSAKSIMLAHSDSSTMKGCVRFQSSNYGSISMGKGGGVTIMEDNSHLAVESGDFYFGQLMLMNIQQTNTTGHRLVLTTSGMPDSHPLLILTDNYFKGETDFESPHILLKGNSFEANTILTKTGGNSDLSDGDNHFLANAIITNTSTTGHFNLGGNKSDFYHGNVTFSSGTKPLIAGYKSYCYFYKNVEVNSSSVGISHGVWAGDTLQQMNGTHTQTYGRLVIDKPSDKVVTATPIDITGSVTFTSGHLETDSTNIITFLAGSGAMDASNSSFVSGPVKKVGDTAFEFPVGKGGDYRPVSISAPDSCTDIFLAEYFNLEQSFTDDLDTSIQAISNCNYWNLIQLVGDNEIDLIFSWSGGNCVPFDTANFNMAFLADTVWINIGQGSITGSVLEGEITISAIIDFGYFTFGTNAPEIVSQGGLTINEGQLLNTNLDPADSVFYYSYNGPVAYYLFEDKIAYSFGFHDVENKVDSSFRMDLKFINVNDELSISHTEQLYYKNFYLGHTGSGIDSVGVFRMIEFNNIYEHINLQATNGSGLQLKFIFEEGSSIDSIRLSFEGADSVKINQDGTIKIFAATRMLEFAKPYGIQMIGESTYKIAITPLLINDILTFSASYNPSYPMFFNFGPRPVRGHTTGNKWSTYIEGSSFFDGAEDLWLDDDDNIYMVGSCINSNLPVVNGAYIQHSNSLTDAFLFKFNTNRGIDWGTYFGGDGADNATGVGVNSEGYVYITGITSSTDLPACTACSADALLKIDVLNNGIGFDEDIFIAKFGGDGTSDHTSSNFPNVFRTYFGGEGYEISRTITVDNNDNVYIGGAVNNTGGFTGSGSTSYGTFPETILTGAYNQAFGQSVDLWDAFLLKIDVDNIVRWCTAIGGDSGGDQEMISALAFDSENNIYATGVTNADGPSTIPQGPVTQNTSEKFPLADPNLMSSSDYTFGNSGGLDAFVIKFNSTGSIAWSSMFGGQGNENNYLSNNPSWNLGQDYMNSGIAVNSSGDIYITGSTTSNTYGSFPDFPQRVITGSSNYYNQSLFNNGICGGTTDAFIALFNSDFELEWSTFYGGCGNEAGVAIACDQFDGHTYITGFTTSNDFPVKTLSGSHSQSLKGSSDAFVLSFLNNLRDYAMYFGGTGGPTEIGKGVVTDDSGINLIFCGTSDDYDGPGTSDFPYSNLQGNLDYFWSTTGLMGDPNQKAYIANLRFGCNPCWRVSGSPSETSSTLQEKHIEDVHIFPNPASTYIEFSYKGNQSLQRIIVYDTYGKMVYSTDYKIQSIDISEFNPGIYIIRFPDQSGNAVSKKFIKE